MEKESFVDKTAETQVLLYIVFFHKLRYNKEKVDISAKENNMETELSRNIDIAKGKAQYDLLCKKILANKTVLA